MKNKINKFLSIFAALIVMIGLSSSVKAANVSVNWPTGEGNTPRDLVAYQIFTGTLEEGNDDSKLGDIQWGEAVIADPHIKTALIDAVGSDDLGNNSTAAQVAAKITENNKEVVAKALSTAISTSTVTKEELGGTTLSSNAIDLPTGYYVIIDETESLAHGEMYNPTVLEVVGTTAITPKTMTIDYGKTVQDGVNGESSGDYGDSADYSIGDSVPFRLYAQIPSKSTLDHYDEYFLEITDTASSGLTLPEAIEVKVYYADDEEGSNKNPLAASNISVTGNTLKITFNNLKLVPVEAMGKYIFVEYNALLNENAAFSNDNKVHIQYSNKPNDSSSKHTTDDDTVYVYCFTIKGTKVGENEKKLKDAKFIISRGSDASEEYLSIDDKGKVTWSSTRPTDGNIISNDAGEFTINGLDAGNYKLWEVKAPDGYNTPSNPFDITITAEHSGDQIITTTTPFEITVSTSSSSSETSDGILNSGEFSINIMNTKGSALPETGGMGTTILYIAGAILLIGSGVMLVTKRRMKTN